VLRRWSSRLQATVGGAEVYARLLQWDAHGRQNVISTQHVQCGTRPAQITEVIDALDQALREMTEQGHDVAGLRCDVAIDDAWMVYEVLEADLGDTPRSAADDLAGAALADTAGMQRNEMVVRWQRQDRMRSLACALPLGAVQALQGVLHRHKVRLGKVNGEMVLAYNATRHEMDPTCSMLAVPRTTGTQLGLIVNSGLAALRFEPSVGDPTSLLERSRALMRSAGFEPDDRTRYYADDNLPEDGETPWIRRVASPHWRSRLDPFPELPRLDLDLSPTRGSVRPMSWVLLAAGVLAATVAALQFQTASGQHRREARALLALEASLNKTRAGGAAKSSPQEARGARASTSAIRELQVPWAKLFAALESVASQNVALLSVEPSAQRQEIRLVAEAKSDDAMLDFLEALRAQDLREVVLVSHQVQAQTPGTPLRFQARAVWESQ
jgi:hypothetical protein